MCLQARFYGFDNTSRCVLVQRRANRSWACWEFCIFLLQWLPDDTCLFYTKRYHPLPISQNPSGIWKETTKPYLASRVILWPKLYNRAWLTIWLIVCKFNKEHLGCLPAAFSGANSNSILSFCPRALAHLSWHLWERLGIERQCVVWKLCRKQKDLHIFTIRDDSLENTFNSNISLFSSLFSGSNPSHVMSVPLPSNWFLIKYFLLPQGDHSVPLHLLVSHILGYQKCYLLWKR